MKLPGAGLAGWMAIGLVLLAANLLFVYADVFAIPVFLCLVAALLSGGYALIGVFMAAKGRARESARALGGLNAVVSSVFFLGICVVIYLIVASWNASWDLTREGLRSLSPLTIQVLENMDKPVTATCFFLESDDEMVAIAREKTLRFLDLCKQYTDQLTVELLDPTVEKLKVEDLGITHASPQGTVVIRSGDRKRVITLSGGSPRLEERDFTNALINVLREENPKVYFLTGHQERDILNQDPQEGGSMLGNLLSGESYTVDRLAIKISDPEVPADCDLLVINKPSSDLHPLEIEAINRYMDGGGRMLILLDPWRNIDPAVAAREQLRPWLEKNYGVLVGADVVVTDAKENRFDIELRPDDAPFSEVEEGFLSFRGCFSKNHPVTARFEQNILMVAARSVTVSRELPEKVGADILLRSLPSFWGETDVERLIKAGVASFDEVDLKGPVPLAVAAVRQVDRNSSPRGRGEARLIVVGDTDFVSNAYLSVPGNLTFILNAVAWLCESEDLLAMRPTALEMTPLMLSDVERRTVAWLSVMLGLQAVLAATIAMIFWRKKHQ